MTFEGFDAAPLIETAGFSPVVGVPAEPDAATLDAALRELVRAERAAARAEATVLDLWIDRAGGSNLRALERPAPGAGTSWHAWALLTDEGGVLHLSAGKEPTLFAAFGEEDEEEIVVVGPSDNPNEVDEDTGDSNGGGYGDGSYGDTPTGGGGVGTDPPEEPNDCRDRNALAARDEIKAHPDDGTKEHASVVYRDANGNVRHSPPIHGDAEGIPKNAILNWMNQNGVTVSQVMGLVHNHDQAEYGQTGDEARANRYPSANDWSFARWMVNSGAGGSQGGSGFAMYVIDTTGRMREFEYADRSTYENLSWTDKTKLSGTELPPVMQGDGSSCG